MRTLSFRNQRVFSICDYADQRDEFYQFFLSQVDTRFNPTIGSKYKVSALSPRKIRSSFESKLMPWIFFTIYLMYINMGC
eukprot:snap_masked-scaffold_6-processed-gene-19.26-mRNA-1 protein AED:1.00 eAED:1.00 QI:0/0/0/0/1/1/4/0/79